MEEKTKIRLKDEILHYLYEEFPRTIHIRDISRVATQRVLNPNQVVELCEEIITDGLEILKKKSSNEGISYKATEKMGEFLLKLGGYSKHRADKESFEHQEWIKEYERKELRDKIHGLQLQNLELTNELNKRKLKTHKIPILISGISALIALGALGWSIYKPSEESSEPFDDSRLRKMEMKIEQLENNLKKDLDSLQS
jgi:hypothetical protein